MKFFFSLMSLFSILATANAATTIVTVSEQQYTVTYESISYVGNESQFQSTQWWLNPVTAQSFAQASSINGINYGYEESTGFGLSYLYSIRSNGVGGSLAVSADTADTRNYAISAVAVPAPVPVLGILPILGFLKRMRMRQKA